MDLPPDYNILAIGSPSCSGLSHFLLQAQQFPGKSASA